VALCHTDTYPTCEAKRWTSVAWPHQDTSPRIRAAVGPMARGSIHPWLCYFDAAREPQPQLCPPTRWNAGPFLVGTTPSASHGDATAGQSVIPSRCSQCSREAHIRRAQGERDGGGGAQVAILFCSIDGTHPSFPCPAVRTSCSCGMPRRRPSPRP
jgi:hypothetical protein